jgi:hypothetical protein
MIGIIQGDTLTLYRRVGGALVPWRTVHGSERDLS